MPSRESTQNPIASRYLRLKLAAEERDAGASLVEYALLVAFIAVACIAAITLLGGEVQGPLNEGSDGLN